MHRRVMVNDVDGVDVRCHNQPSTTSRQGPIAILINVEALDFGFQGCSRDAEFGSGPLWPRDPAVSMGQCGFNYFSLVIRQGRPQAGMILGLWPQPGLSHRKGVGVAKNDSAFDHVL
jgi:hypothetical protein